MKKIISIAFVISVAAFAGEQKSTESAIEWLNLIDSGSYEKSWNQSAPLLQSQVTKEQWIQAMNQVRAPLGEAMSREVNSADEHTSLPNVPDGDYVVITLVTNFENKKASIETITVSKIGNEWKAVGYFIK
ncbi:DUF4019 domain-containing protein [Haliea sp.]|uniref:DUF4019 domain-containing protein n=1 Tax=Haliea sp. TaxID=1932666 RepID=UPI0025C03C73|nr:DUF4019 domain-containing protein [Haliea sp.]|tara:strand:+ start:118680 stop:119072 length:393 start_codon:yes stop_codon:yes gene_type:complete